MKLADIMSHAGLSFYAQVALVIFLAVFVAIVIRTFLPSRSAELQEAALLPLDDATADRVRARRKS
ncbi:MAG: cbb3-type cytochrome c oxidase subunit 3 [Gemmatimonadaceae bacterium]